MKVFYAILIFISISFETFSQITLTKVEAKKAEEVHYENPYTNYIGEKVFLPPIPKENKIICFTIDPTKIERGSLNEGDIYYYCQYENCNNCKTYCSNGDSIGNKYYKILDVFKGELFDGEHSSYNSSDYQKSFFLLKNNENGDSLYIDVLTVLKTFISTSFYDKLKEKYDGKNLIYIDGTDGQTFWDIRNNSEVNLNIPYSNWKCAIQVFELKNEYNLCYILTNEKNAKIEVKESGFENYERKVLIDNPNCTFRDDFPGDGAYISCRENRSYIQFLTENEYIERRRKLKLKEDEYEATLRKEYNSNEKKRQQEHAIHLQNSINKYGKTYGELIANGKVKLGMTKEMCKASWGNPFNVSKTTTENGVIEIWKYTLNRNLLFVNGSLSQIQE